MKRILFAIFLLAVPVLLHAQGDYRSSIPRGGLIDTAITNVTTLQTTVSVLRNYINALYDSVALLRGVSPASPAPSDPNSFPVIAEIFWTGQPDTSYFTALGLRGIAKNGGNNIYQSWVTSGGAIQQSLIRSTADAKYAVRAQLWNNMFAYDIEDLDTDSSNVGSTAARANAHTYAQRIGWAKNQQPSMKIGIYGQVPVTDLYFPSPHTWRQGANNLLQELADTVDFIAPSIYLYNYESEKTYESYAVPIVSEAKRLGNGKPIYPYISPAYHPSSTHHGAYADSTQFAHVLHILRDSCHVDGVFLWGGLTGDAMGSDHTDWAWQSTSGWWKALLAFLNSTPPPTTTLTYGGADSVTGWSVDSLTVNFTVSGTNPYEVIPAHGYCLGHVTAVVVDGTSWADSLAGERTVTYGSNHAGWVYGKKGLSAGSHSACYHFSSAFAGNVVAVGLSGVNQSTPVASVAVANGHFTASQPSVSITNSSTQWVVDMVGDYDADPHYWVSAGSGQTIRARESTGNAYAQLAVSTKSATGSSVSWTGAGTGDKDWVHLAILINQVP